MQRIIRNARRAPVMRPGKKPAMMAFVGKELQCSWGVGVWFVAEFEAAVLGTVVAMLGASVSVVDALVDAEDGDGVVEDDPCWAFIMHRLFWHEKPCGQQELPHDCRVPVNTVL